MFTFQISAIIQSDCAKRVCRKFSHFWVSVASTCSSSPFCAEKGPTPSSRALDYIPYMNLWSLWHIACNVWCYFPPLLFFLLLFSLLILWKAFHGINNIYMYITTMHAMYTCSYIRIVRVTWLWYAYAKLYMHHESEFMIHNDMHNIIREHVLRSLTKLLWSKVWISNFTNCSRIM